MATENQTKEQREQFKKDVTKVTDKNLTNSQFGLTDIPFHTHNGQDSSKVPAQFLDFTNFATWGLITLSGGAGTITNQNITTTSTIVVTCQSSLLNPLNAICSNGSAAISGGGGAVVVNYLIIF